jgi:hypothetical protein
VATDAACCNAAGVFWRVRRRQSVLDLLVCAGTDGQGRSAEVEEVGLRYVREWALTARRLRADAPDADGFQRPHMYSFEDDPDTLGFAERHGFTVGALTVPTCGCARIPAGTTRATRRSTNSRRRASSASVQPRSGSTARSSRSAKAHRPERSKTKR